MTPYGHTLFGLPVRAHHIPGVRHWAVVLSSEYWNADATPTIRAHSIETCAG